MTQEPQDPTTGPQASASSPQDEIVKDDKVYTAYPMVEEETTEKEPPTYEQGPGYYQTRSGYYRQYERTQSAAWTESQGQSNGPNYQNTSGNQQYYGNQGQQRSAHGPGNRNFHQNQQQYQYQNQYHNQGRQNNWNNAQQQNRQSQNQQYQQQQYGQNQNQNQNQQAQNNSQSGGQGNPSMSQIVSQILQALQQNSNNNNNGANTTGNSTGNNTTAGAGSTAPGGASLLTQLAPVIKSFMNNGGAGGGNGNTIQAITNFVNQNGGIGAVLNMLGAANGGLGNTSSAASAATGGGLLGSLGSYLGKTLRGKPLRGGNMGPMNQMNQMNQMGQNGYNPMGGRGYRGNSNMQGAYGMSFQGGAPQGQGVPSWNEVQQMVNSWRNTPQNR